MRSGWWLGLSILAPLAGCYASHERVSCGGIPSELPPLRDVTPPAAGEPALEAPDEPWRLMEGLLLGGGVDLEPNGVGFGLVSSGRPAHFVELLPDGHLAGELVELVSSGSAVTSFAGGRYAVALRGVELGAVPGPVFGVMPSGGTDFTSVGLEARFEELALTAAGPGECWALATRVPELPAELRFVGSDGRTLTPRHELEGSGVGPPALVAHGERVLVFWNANWPGVGRFVAGQTFVGGEVASDAVRVAGDFLSQPTLVAASLLDRVVVVGVSTPDRRAELLLVDPAAPGVGVSHVAIGADEYRAFAVAPAPAEGFVATCGLRIDGGIEVSLVGLDARVWGSPIVLPLDARSVDCAWNGSELLVVWQTLASHEGFSVLATRLRPTFL